MIRVDELVVDQVYYVAISFEVVTRTYVGTLPGNENQQPVYIFAEANRRPIKQYGIDLLTYFSDERSALELVIGAMNLSLETLRERLGQLTPNHLPATEPA
ncbi:hypothetical protein A6C57_01335 [Fibrella sp. ES10-3-2-2]|nr:hypothetical protein A6C57_01335 [Fibrella sp. ES10-3-2-2]